MKLIFEELIIIIFETLVKIVKKAYENREEKIMNIL